MTIAKELQFNREREKALSELLVAECRSDSYTHDSVVAIIDSGADINFKNSRPLYFAAKLHKFDLVELLIRQGARVDGIAKTYIAAMCDFKGFCDEMEPSFFKTLDLVHSKEGNYMELFTPYINNMAVNGRLDKLKALMERYYLTENEIAGAVYIRIIFEIINGGFDEMLDFIQHHKKWMDQSALDLAVSTNEWQVLEHIVFYSKDLTPSESSVAQAVYLNSVETLYILKRTGYKFYGKPLILQKALDSAKANGSEALEFLLENGVTWQDRIRGKTLSQTAILNGGSAAALLAKQFNKSTNH